MHYRSFVQSIQTAYKREGVIAQLIAVNTLVFLFFFALHLVERVFSIRGLEYGVKVWLAAPGNPTELIYRPWSIVTQLFTHGDFKHYAFNMIAFYFIARIFVSFFGERRLVTTYFLAGVFAYLFHVACFYLIPAFQQSAVPGLMGASGAVMAIFTAIAVYRPKFKVYLYGLIKVPLIALAALYIFYDLRAINSQDGIAHLAHLGGALFGALSVIRRNALIHFMNRLKRWFAQVKQSSKPFKARAFNRQSAPSFRTMTDEDHNFNKHQRQQRIDAILDKIAKRGYEGLTQEEKEMLFDESKRNR